MTTSATDRNLLLGILAMQMKELWQGKYTRRGWEQLREKVSPDLAATMALVYGRMNVRHKQPEMAEQFLHYVLDNQPSNTPIYRDAKQQLEKLEPTAG